MCLVLYTGHDVVRYLSYHSPAYDLGFFDQLASNLSAGRGWTSSFIGYDFRGQHWEPILLVWAQLYRVVATPIWLLLINSVALALAPLAAWRLARRWLGIDSVAAPLAALATACSPLVLRAAGFDYHSEALTPLLALLALEAANRRRWLVMAASCAVLVLLKEDAFLVVAGIGWLTWRAEGRRAGLAFAAAALAGFAVVVGVYMPSLRNGQASDLVARYAYLGSTGHAASPADILAGMVTHPLTWLTHLGSGAPLEGAALALLALALLPLLSGWAFFAVVPVLAVALLSNDPLQSSLQLQYGAEVFPLLLACALLGWRRAATWASLHRVRVLQRAALAAVAGVLAAVPLTVDLHARVADMSGIERRAGVQGVLADVPAGAAVAASSQLVPHLSDRPAVSELPDIRGASWVVVDADAAPSRQAIGAGYATAVSDLPREFRLVESAAGVSLWARP
jgi:uncharacterized membrane protein